MRQHSVVTVTVIIPTYNRAGLLKQAIAALHGQTRPPDQIIVVDDGSTDSTPTLLSGYGNTITVIRQPNRGRASARNAGLRAAYGDWIILHDDDDLLPPESIQCRLDYAETMPEMHVIYTDAVILSADGQPVALFAPKKPRPQGDVFFAIAKDNFALIHSVMFRRTCLDQAGFFDELLPVKYCEDWEFWCRIAAYWHVAYLPLPLAHYRIHQFRYTLRDNDRIALDAYKVQKQVMCMERFEALSAGEQAEIYCRFAVRCLRIGSTKEAYQALSQAARCVHPHTPISILRLRLLTAGLSLLPRPLRLSLTHIALRLRNMFTSYIG